MSDKFFKIIMLHGRPAAGKSEVIDFLKKLPLEERIRRFHIGEFIEIDDFPMLWAWFEEDAILEKMGKERLHSDEKGYFKYQWQWNLLVQRISLEYEKAQIENPETDLTSIIEFSRGKEHGGYTSAYDNVDDEILKNCAIVYINVSFEESMRKNRKRKNPDRLYSILEHSVEDEKLTNLYRHDDFHEFVSKDENYVEVKGIKVPYAILENEDDVTSARGKALDERLENTLNKLWESYKNK